ncbi:MAG: hypothetical protein EOM12_13790 [Verrucomicrobiae bacterium]|nr:hypothetical protein [Verrucomicrobiae bacterium]
MGKLLKPLVIVMLVLSLVSLVLGIMLFGKREELKGRTQKLENSVIKVAENIHFEEFKKDDIKFYGKMDAELTQLAVKADIQYTDLQQTKSDLDNTKADLARTQNELDGTKQELADTKDQIDGLKTELDNKEVEIAQAQTQISQLEEDKSGLQIQIDSMSDKLMAAEDARRDLEDQIATLEAALDRVALTDNAKSTRELKGLTGKVLFVNPYWNFVVLDIGREKGLVPDAEMLVHRDDRLIGKVSISTVEETMAVAEIVNDWEQVPIREGDYVLF